MSESQTVTFQQALDSVEALPGYQQDDLIEIIRRRRIEQRREELAASIKETEEAYERGELTGGTVEDLMRELDE